MKAIGLTTSHEINHDDSLYEFEKQRPTPKELDLIIKVNAVSINPIDTKVRVLCAQDKILEEPKVLGYDAVGIVEEIGSGVEEFEIGDRVFYAGDITRHGSNAQFQAVDSRIVAKAPTSLNDAECAVIPLTSLTGWESIFDRLKVNPNENKTILIIGGAGGVGSITTQIVKQMTNLTVITTASREETSIWTKSMGADYIANHKDLVNSVRKLGFENVDYIFNAADTTNHWDAMAELIAPQGSICSIVASKENVDLNKLRDKSVTFIWEVMFTRSRLNTKDIRRQQDILKQMANLLDEGKIKTTLNQSIHGFSVENFKKAHSLIEGGKTIGKIAIVF